MLAQQAPQRQSPAAPYTTCMNEVDGERRKGVAAFPSCRVFSCQRAQLSDLTAAVQQPNVFERGARARSMACGDSDFAVNRSTVNDSTYPRNHGSKGLAAGGESGVTPSRENGPTSNGRWFRQGVPLPPR